MLVLALLIHRYVWSLTKANFTKWFWKHVAYLKTYIHLWFGLGNVTTLVIENVHARFHQQFGYIPTPNYFVHSSRYKDDSVNGLVIRQHTDGFVKYGVAGISSLRHRRQRRKGGRHDCCCFFHSQAIGNRRSGFAGFRVRVVRRKKREQITEIRRYESNQMFSILEFLRS